MLASAEIVGFAIGNNSSWTEERSEMDIDAIVAGIIEELFKENVSYSLH